VFTRDSLMGDIYEDEMSQALLSEMFQTIDTRMRDKTGSRRGDDEAYTKMVMSMPLKTLILIGVPAEDVDGSWNASIIMAVDRQCLHASRQSLFKQPFNNRFRIVAVRARRHHNRIIPICHTFALLTMRRQDYHCHTLSTDCFQSATSVFRFSIYAATEAITASAVS
jgi:hypothetical protein